MQIQSALAVATDDKQAASKGAELIFRRDALGGIRQLIEPGIWLEVKFPDNHDPEHLYPLHDLRHAHVLELDRESVREFTRAYTSEDPHARLKSPISFRITDQFDLWFGQREKFFNDLCARLDYVKILPA